MSILASLGSLTCCGRRQSRDSQDSQEPSQTQSQTCLRPPSPPILPPLRPVSLPHILPAHSSSFSEQGWTTVSYHPPSDPLQLATEGLFTASKAFFALPLSHKETFKTTIGSEEGWSCVEGEKEFITLRALSATPPELRDAASAFWAEAGDLLHEILGKLAESLGLQGDDLKRFSKPCKRLGEKTATMVRLFRYEGFEGREGRTVAEAHKDLGLLSLVVGDTPGLEVWDCQNKRWFQIEKSYYEPAASLLVGRQLERLSNGRYSAGGHLVQSYPDLPAVGVQRKYRYSIVFVLRAHSPLSVDTDTLTTSITLDFRYPLRNTTAGDLFRDIQRAHFNINTNIQERNEQKQKLAEKKSQTSQPLDVTREKEKLLE